MPEPLTITAAIDAIRSGELTPRDLLEQCLARMDQYEPQVRAWEFVDRERARVEADALTATAKAGTYRSPLHGIPIGVKDIIDVADMPTGCGSSRWRGSIARKDAVCVANLRRGGALILGKTVTTAYAYLDPPITRNPWNRSRTPGGSSSGSAAATASTTALACIGTQTGGSLIRPASFCGVACFKPAHDRASTSGVLPLAPSLDHIGVMSRNVAGLRLLAGFLDTIVQDHSLPELAVTNDFFLPKLEHEAAEHFHATIERLRSQLPIRDLRLPARFAQIPEHHLAIMSAEAARTHAERFARYPDDYPPKIRELIEMGLSRTFLEVDTARKFREAMRQETDLGHRILILPAATGGAPTTETTGNPICNSPWSFLGFPVLSVPSGFTREGLPLAVQLVAMPGQESALFAVGEKLESILALPVSLPPVPA